MKQYAYIQATGVILRASVTYILSNRLVEPARDVLIDLIMSYIQAGAEAGNLPDIEELCIHFNISRGQLYEIVRNYTGKTVGALISDIKIDRAKYLLTSTPEISIAETAERCGFCDYSYFDKVFKRHMGISPQKYRELYGDKDK